jgi:hypothetical protein
MVDVRKCIERFVEVYNQPGSPVFPLYAEEVEWVFSDGGQLTGGSIADYATAVARPAGREELFKAFRDIRGITKEMQERGEYVAAPKPGTIKDMRFPSILHINVEGNLGVLECTWAGTLVGSDGNPDTPMTANMIFVLRVNEQGLITMDHDYFLWHQRKFNSK